MKFLLIGAFGLLGVFARYFAGAAVSRYLSPPFPFATFLINLSGAFLIGIAYVLGVERAAWSAELRLGIMVGFLGGYTTFSSYCLEAVRLVEEGEYVHAVAYFGLSPMLGLVAVFFGMFLTRILLGGAS